MCYFKNCISLENSASMCRFYVKRVNMHLELCIGSSVNCCHVKMSITHNAYFLYWLLSNMFKDWLLEFCMYRIIKLTWTNFWLHAGKTKIDFDKCVATPAMIKHVKKVCVLNFSFSLLGPIFIQGQHLIVIWMQISKYLKKLMPETKVSLMSILPFACRWQLSYKNLVSAERKSNQWHSSGCERREGACTFWERQNCNCTCSPRKGIFVSTKQFCLPHHCSNSCPLNNNPWFFRLKLQIIVWKKTLVLSYMLFCLQSLQV